jgi:hypothetical protein
MYIIIKILDANLVSPLESQLQHVPPVRKEHLVVFPP